MGPNVVRELHMTPGKVFKCKELPKVVSKKFLFSSNFGNPQQQNCKFAAKNVIIISIERENAERL